MAQKLQVPHVLAQAEDGSQPSVTVAFFRVSDVLFWTHDRQMCGQNPHIHTNKIH